jgi:hypothetical protein
MTEASQTKNGTGGYELTYKRVIWIIDVGLGNQGKVRPLFDVQVLSVWDYQHSTPVDWG